MAREAEGEELWKLKKTNGRLVKKEDKKKKTAGEKENCNGEERG